MGQNSVERLLTATLLLTLLYIAGSQTVRAQESTASLEETQKWLKEKITNFSSYTNTLQQRVKAESVSFEGCSLTLKVLIVEARMEATEIVDLTDLDPENVKVFKNPVSIDNGYRVICFTKGGKNRVRYTISDAKGNKSGAEDSLQLTFDEELANRVAKAFSHAIKLCQKKEPF